MWSDQAQRHLDTNDDHAFVSAETVSSQRTRCRQHCDVRRRCSCWARLLDTTLTHFADWWASREGRKEGTQWPSDTNNEHFILSQRIRHREQGVRWNMPSIIQVSSSKAERLIEGDLISTYALSRTTCSLAGTSFLISKTHEQGTVAVSLLHRLRTRHR